MREEARSEVGRHQELIQFHGREVGGAHHHIGMLNNEFAIEPAADDAVCIRSVLRHVEGVEFEASLDAVPFVISEKRVTLS